MNTSGLVWGGPMQRIVHGQRASAILRCSTLGPPHAPAGFTRIPGHNRHVGSIHLSSSFGLKRKCRRPCRDSSPRRSLLWCGHRGSRSQSTLQTASPYATSSCRGKRSQSSCTGTGSLKTCEKSLMLPLCQNGMDSPHWRRARAWPLFS